MDTVLGLIVQNILKCNLCCHKLPLSVKILFDWKISGFCILVISTFIQNYNNFERINIKYKYNFCFFLPSKQRKAIKLFLINLIICQSSANEHILVQIVHKFKNLSVYKLRQESKKAIFTHVYNLGLFLT